MEGAECRPPWWSDHVPDAAIAARAMDSVLPAGAPWRAAPLGEGWDFFTFRAHPAGGGGEMVVRIPRRAETVPWLDREIAVLDRLAAAFGDADGVAIPHYAVRMARDDGIRHPFGVYPMLPGTPVDAAPFDESAVRVVARDVGRFLAALHRIPLSIFPPGEHQEPPDDSPECWRDEVGAARDVLGPARAASCESLLADLGAEPAGPRVCAHADLGAEHLLADPAGGGLAGVIDWGDACPDVRAGDFAGPWIRLGEAFLGAALETYDPPDPGAVARFARFRGTRGILHEIRWCAWRGDRAAAERFVARLDGVIAAA